MRRAIAPVLEGARLERRRDPRSTAGAAVRPEIVARELVGERVDGGRSPWQVSDCSVRIGSGSPDPPPDDGVIASRAPRGAGRRPAHACRSQIRQWHRTSPTGTCGVSGPGSCSRSASSTPFLNARLGPEPLGSLSAARLGLRLQGRRAPLKSALLDQRTVAGLGNIYVDEALWRSRLHPLRSAGSLDDDELARLHRAIRTRTPPRYRAPGLDAPRLRAPRREQRPHAGRVPCLRPRRRAVRPLRHTAAEDRGRGADDDVLPALPAGAAARDRRRTTSRRDASLS